MTRPTPRPRSSAAKLLETGFHLVAPEDFGLALRPEIVATPGFAGIHIAAALRPSQTTLLVSTVDALYRPETAMAPLVSWDSITRRASGPLTLLSDTRAVRGDPAQQPLVLGHADAIRPRLTEGLLRVRFAKVVLLVPTNWTRHFWSGFLASMPLPSVLTYDVEQAWAETDATPNERLRIEEALALALHEVNSPRHQAESALAQDPGTKLPELARRLGVSTRTLQRSLTEEGTSFGTLRESARLEHAQSALSRGEKVAAVGAALGFESLSHFIAWFKRKTGRTPGRGRTDEDEP